MSQYAIEFLRREFEKRQRANARYSLRAFAKSLGVSSGRLSEYLNGKRDVSYNVGKRIVENLKLSKDEKFDFLVDLIVSKQGENDPSNKTVSLNGEEMELLSSWYHIAILHYLKIQDDFQKKSIDSISKSFGLEADVVLDSLERLERLGFVEGAKGHYQLKDEDVSFSTSEHIASDNYDKEFIKKAMESVDSDNSSKGSRIIKTRTMAIDSSKIDEAKLFIEKFEKGMQEFLVSGDLNAVYSLNIQLFPLSSSSDNN